MTELELASRAANAVATRNKDAGFPVENDFDTADCSVRPPLATPTLLERARCDWSVQQANGCLGGSHGTGKPHRSLGLGRAAWRVGLRVRFVAAAARVSRWEKEPTPAPLDRVGGIAPMP